MRILVLSLRRSHIGISGSTDPLLDQYLLPLSCRQGVIYDDWQSLELIQELGNITKNITFIMASFWRQRCAHIIQLLSVWFSRHWSRDIARAAYAEAGSNEKYNNVHREWNSVEWTNHKRMAMIQHSWFSFPRTAQPAARGLELRLKWRDFYEVAMHACALCMKRHVGAGATRAAKKKNDID